MRRYEGKNSLVFTAFSPVLALTCSHPTHIRQGASHPCLLRICSAFPDGFVDCALTAYLHSLRTALPALKSVEPLLSAGSPRTGSREPESISNLSFSAAYLLQRTTLVPAIL